MDKLRPRRAVDLFERHPADGILALDQGDHGIPPAAVIAAKDAFKRFDCDMIAILARAFLMPSSKHFREAPAS